MFFNFVKEIFKRFLIIILAPLYEFEVIWSLIPVYLTWFITDILAERKGVDPTSAVQNGFTALWIGMDWMHQLTRKGISSIELSSMPYFVFPIFMILWGCIAIYAGLWRKWYMGFIARIREVSYAQIVLTPIIYKLVPLDFLSIISVIVFFPLMYGVMEAINRIADKFFEKMELWGEEEW